MPTRAPTSRSKAARRILGVGMLVLVLEVGIAVRGDPLTNESCLDCHEQTPPGRKDKDTESNPAIETLRAGPFASSVHGTLQGIDCHLGITDIPHDDKLAP